MEDGAGPAGDWVDGSESIAYGAEAEKVSPGMKSDKVGADGEKRWGEIEKEKEEGGFDCLVDRGSGEKVEGGGEKESGDERERGGWGTGGGS